MNSKLVCRSREAGGVWKVPNELQKLLYVKYPTCIDPSFMMDITRRPPQVVRPEGIMSRYQTTIILKHPWGSPETPHFSRWLPRPRSFGLRTQVGTRCSSALCILVAPRPQRVHRWLRTLIVVCCGFCGLFTLVHSQSAVKVWVLALTCTLTHTTHLNLSVEKNATPLPTPPTRSAG